MIWVARTQPGAARLAAALADAGYRVHCASALDIARLRPWRAEVWPPGAHTSEPIVGETSLGPAPAVAVAFSVHAADEYVVSGLAAKAGADVLHVAVGAQTGAVLQEHGLVALVPARETSEGVVDLLSQPSVAAALRDEATAWLLAGVGGRGTVAQALRDRGVRVVKFALYERRPMRDHELDLGRIQAIVVGSIASLEAVAEICARGSAVSAPALFVPSARVASAAAELGFAEVHDVGSADVAATTRAIEERVAKASSSSSR